MIREILYKWFKVDPFPCQSCETLKLQLSIANHEKQELLNSILSFTQKPAEITVPSVDYEKVKPKIATWNMRRQMLEAEDRATAALMAEQRKKQERESIEKLEKETGVATEVKDAQAIGGLS